MNLPRFAHIAANDTLPKLLRYNARHHGGDVALREKKLGLWKSYTWRDFHERTKLWALALRNLGVGEGDTVAIIGDSRPDWIAAAIATHALGAKSLGLYQDGLDAEVGYLIGYAEAKVIVAEDEEQIDKMLRVTASIPSVEKLVYCDPRGMRKYTDARLVDRDSLLETARATAAAEPKLWDDLVDRTDGENIAVLCSTSGTTSHPKLASLTSGHFIRHVATYCDLVGLGPDDEYVSLLPMGWVGEQFQALYQPLICRHKLNFVEEPETVMADLREIAPTFMFLAPRVWEQIAANVRAQIMDASFFKRRMFEWGVKRGLKAVERGRTSKLAQALVLRALRDRLGFTRLRFASTGGAPMGPDTFKFFMAMGLPMLQLYGQTELGGIYCIQRRGEVDFDTVGRGLSDDYKIRIDKPDAQGVGEIVSQHPYMFKGYYKNDAATAADLREGWMHTGDAGYFKPSGQLVVIDRMRDLATTSAGERFSPQYIENKLKFSPYVSEVVVLGDQRAYLAAIVCIRFPIVSKWAEQNRMSFTTYSDLAARPQVCDLIAGEVERMNSSLPPAQRLSKFVLLYKELDADDGELTRTRKVRRGVIAEKYADIIEAIYSEKAEVKIDTEIAFQDGSRQRVRTTMPITALGPPAATARSA
ncbi:MAG TPA: AMP-binding protein [Hyphomicrobiaceae bacterium]|nr:AMP-binding protein [Hyphomicrobiaceae bacterium]